MSEPLDVTFVGGVAHSGTSLVAALLEAHPREAAMPLAARFHCDRRGMPALLAGQLSLDDFLGQVRGRWWNGSGAEPGLREVVDRSLLESELERFHGAYYGDPLAACRELFFSLMGPLAGADRALVDSNPGNLRQAQPLARLFPEARFVHVVRDGRDVACGGAVEDSRGLREGIRRWAGKLRELEAALRGTEDGAPYAIPDRQLALVVLDELAAGERERAYESLLGTLGLEDDPAPRDLLARRLGSDEVGRGRWRARARGPAGWALARRYRRTLDELERESNHAARPLIEAYERLG